MSSALSVLADTPHSASVMRNSGLGIPASSAAFPAEIFPSSNSFTAAATNNAGARASGATLRARSRSSGICTVIAFIVRPFLPAPPARAERTLLVPHHPLPDTLRAGTGAANFALHPGAGDGLPGRRGLLRQSFQPIYPLHTIEARPPGRHQPSRPQR